MRKQSKSMSTPHRKQFSRSSIGEHLVSIEVTYGHLQRVSRKQASLSFQGLLAFKDLRTFLVGFRTKSQS